MQEELSKYKGWNCYFGYFSNSHSRLTLYLEHPSQNHQKEELHLLFTQYVRGPTQWKNCNRNIAPLKDKPGCYKIADTSVGFEVIGYDEINVGGNLNCLLATKT